MKRKILSMILIGGLMLTIPMTAYGGTIDVQKKPSETYVEEMSCVVASISPYMQTKSMKLSDSYEKVVIANQISNFVEKAGMDCNYDIIETLAEDVAESGGETSAVTIKNIYYKDVEVDNEHIRQPLTTEEVQELRASSNFPKGDSVTHSGGKFTLGLTVTKKSSYRYRATAVGTWSAMGSNAEIYPAQGDNAIALAWGGGMTADSSTWGAEGTNFKGESIKMTKIATTCDSGRGWSFSGQDGNATSTAVKNVRIWTEIYQAKPVGGMTSILADYVHTFKKLDWSFTVGLGYGNGTIGGNIGVNGAYIDKCWHVKVGVDDIPK